MPASTFPPHRRVRLAGFAIIVAGLLAAGAVFVTAGSDTADGDGTGDLTHQREMQQLARLGGQASVQTAEFDHWLSSLWHGRRLAGTLAVLALALGGGCLWLGGLMAVEPE